MSQYPTVSSPVATIEVVNEEQPPPYSDFKSVQSEYLHGTAQIVVDLNKIDNYQCWSIFNILFCCWFLGCFACYFSCETDKSKEQGDIQQALNASRNARTMNIIATILGIILNALIILYRIGLY
jgi:hypothetical protein